MTASEDNDVARILRGVLWLGRRLRAERPQGEVTPSAIGLLGTLSRSGAMPAVRLADEEGLQPQSLSRLIASLETAGCITRHRSETDRRAIVIALTDHGRETLAADMRARRQWLEHAMAASLTKEENRTLVEAAGLMLRLAHHSENG